MLGQCLRILRSPPFGLEDWEHVHGTEPAPEQSVSRRRRSRRPESVEIPEDRADLEAEADQGSVSNDANVAAIYGLEEVDGKQYLILEYVEGEGLDERISRGAILLDEALPSSLPMRRHLETLA